jgi:hypothetical protein
MIISHSKMKLRALLVGIFLLCFAFPKNDSMAQTFSNYVKPSSHFPNPVGPYIPKEIPQPVATDNELRTC